MENTSAHRVSLQDSRFTALSASCPLGHPAGVPVSQLCDGSMLKLSPEGEGFNPPKVGQ